MIGMIGMVSSLKPACRLSLNVCPVMHIYCSVWKESVSMTDRIGLQLGNYRLLQEVGRGNFAEVYLAEHLYLERPAAIKVLHTQMNPETQERFRREARTIAHLQHPSILQVLDFGFAEQTPYLVMQYTPGGTLREYHPKGTRLPVEQIVIYANQIASALDYAHQQRVIHRDIKPHNLLLTATHEVVLADFGLAVVQRSRDALSLSNPAAGTPLYMAPEQIQDHPCPASDQYALGVMVYEWLVGEAPFGGSTLIEVFSHHLYQTPPSLCERLPDLPAAVEAVVFRALAKNPEQRFACVTDFASAFEEACEITRRLTPGLLQQRTHQPIDSQKTLFISSAPARTLEASSASTQPAPITMQGTERGQATVLAVEQPITLKHNKRSLAQSNRQRFLRRVRAIWIEGMLDHSLHGAALIELGLQEQLDALANPWHLVLHYPDSAPRSFPPGTRISDVYDAANEELLILGAPGSGKTTLVLELVRDLLARAEQDEHQLMPVVFPLSTWATKQQPLAGWMVEELTDKYQVPSQLARSWMETNVILPLLDGLDEVATEKRTTCIETINRYHQEHPFLPLVVSSRSADYLQQAGRLTLTTAVTIQSLTEPQVDDYVARGGEALWTLRVALHQDAALRELAQTPLMLSILTLTYHDMPVENLLQGGIAPTRQQVFERYVERMLTHRANNIHYQTEQTRKWLRALAKQLSQQKQTVFYLEQLQPDWLSGSGMLRWYERLAVRMPDILMGILTTFIITTLLFRGSNSVISLILGGLLGVLVSGGRTLQQPPTTSKKSRSIDQQQLFHQLLRGSIVGLGVGLMFGFGDGLSTGLSGILLQMLLVKSTTVQSSSQSSPLESMKWQRRRGNRALQNGLLAGLLVALTVALTVGWSAGINIGFSTGRSIGLIVGLSTGFLSLLLSGESMMVHVTDRLIWSWASLGRSLWSPQHLRTSLLIATLVGFSIGLVSGLSAGLSVVPIAGVSAALSAGLIFGLINGVSIGPSTGLGYWLLIGLFQGVSSETMSDQQRLAPNQGIRRSAFNGLVLGCISALCIGLSVGLIFELSVWLSIVLVGLLYTPSVGLSIELNTGLSVGLSVGLSAGLLAGLLKGGLACLRHYTLRFLLWRAGSMPWNTVRFLDYAAEHILLRKVGGGYIFIHRLLLEYFASLDTTSPSDIKRR